MAGINLNSLTENASRLGARIQESFTEHTRDLAIGRNAGAAYFDVTEDKIRNVRKQLDSSSDREKLDGLKTLVAVRIADFVVANHPDFRSSSQKVAMFQNTFHSLSRTLRRRTWKYGSLCTSSSFAMLNPNQT